MSKLASLTLLLTVIFAAPSYPQEVGAYLNRIRDRYGVTSEIDNFNTMCNLLCMSVEYAKSIGLTDAQILKIKPLYIEMETSNKNIKNKLLSLELEISEIMNDKDFDFDKANIVCQNITQLKMINHFQILKYIKEIRSILTSDQFMKMNMKISVYSGKDLMEKALSNSNKPYNVIYSRK